MRRILMTAVVAVAAAGAVPGGAVQPQTAPVHWFEVENLVVGDQVTGASATLERDLEGTTGLTMELTTTGLRGGNVYTVWWLVFNAPQHCVTNTAGPVRCGAPDVFNPVTEAAHILADGQTIPSSGLATFRGRADTGDRSRVAFAWEPGLTEPGSAEAFLVVRDHGPPVDPQQQSSTMNGGCIQGWAMPTTGVPGSYPCENQQIAMFPTA